MAWYNPSWNYRIPVTVTNGSSTSALSYCQVAISLTGSAYTSFHAHAKSDGSDIVVTDSDGATTLPFALEGIDTTNSVVYILAKLSLAANASKTIYVYYGNAAATSRSSYSGALTPQVALAGPTDIVTQSGTNPSAGYNSNPKLILLKNQNQVHGGGSSLNGDLLAFILMGAADNGASNGKLGKLRCPAGSDPSSINNWTLSTVLNPAASHGASIMAAMELADGTILVCYEYDTNTNMEAAKGQIYIGKSTDGGNTWSNVSTSPANPLALPTGAVYGTTVGLYWGQFYVDGSGNLYLTYYGYPGSDTTSSCYLMKCAAGLDPSNGSNWTQFSTIARDASQQIYYDEPNVIAASPNHLLCVMRNDGNSPNTGDLYVTRSTDGGSTWGAPTAMGLPHAALASGSSSAVSPWLLMLASGNILLSFGNRNVSSVENSAVTFGTLCCLSTDGGASFFDRYFAEPGGYAPVTNRVDYGVSSAVQLANGNIVFLTYRGVAATTQCNIAVSVFTEDWVANQGNLYNNCEASTGWTLGAHAAADATHAHNGTKAIKMDNSAGAGSYGYLTPWPNPVRAPGKVAVSGWTYASQIASRGCMMGVSAAYQGNRQANVSVDATPYHAIWFNGTAYQDTGTVAGINAWYKLTDYWNTPGNAGTILVNNVSAATNQTHWNATGIPAILEFLAFSDVSGTVNDTWWVDDVQVHQYVPSLPTLSVGSEQPIPHGVAPPAGGAIMLLL
jgi:hypothetical protein